MEAGACRGGCMNEATVPGIQGRSASKEWNYEIYILLICCS